MGSFPMVEAVQMCMRSLQLVRTSRDNKNIQLESLGIKLAICREKYADFCKGDVAVLNSKKPKFPVSETRGAAPLPPCGQTQGNVLFLTKTKPLQEKCGLSGSWL